MSIELVHVYRGSEVESIHRGDVVAIDSKENIVFSYGDPYKKTFWRSSAKPFQIIPFIESNGIEKFNISTKELAIMTSSHNGEAAHVDTINMLLNKMNQSVDCLDCGVSAPMFGPYKNEMLKSNKAFTQANNPCSGKHTAMIGYGLLNTMDLENYIQLEHPIQQEMLSVVSKYTHYPQASIAIAIDGCGVPVFGLPLLNMAIAYTYLLKKETPFQLITHAMTHEAFYVAGTGRLDTIIMEETKQRIVAKLGAESVYCMTLLDYDIAIAVKIEDGAYRALDVLIPDLLLKHKYIDLKTHQNIQARLRLSIKNHRKEIVGHYQSVL